MKCAIEPGKELTREQIEAAQRIIELAKQAFAAIRKFLKGAGKAIKNWLERFRRQSKRRAEAARKRPKRSKRKQYFKIEPARRMKDQVQCNKPAAVRARNQLK